MTGAGRGRLVVGLAAWLVAVLPGSLASQVAQPPPTEPLDGTVPTIDLGPVLDTLQPLGDRTGSPVDAEVSIPQYTRSGEIPDAAPVVSSTILIPLQGDTVGRDRIVRMSGERQTARMTVDLPFPGAVEDVFLSYRNSINVLPSQSQLRIRVNGTDLPPVTPAAFEGFESIALPRDLLIEGRNVIDVTARHAHRIFCGPDATFEIWTEIDLSQSGVRLSRDRVPQDGAGFAMALASQLGQRGRVPLRIARDADDETVRRIAARLAGITGGEAFSILRKDLYDNADTVPPIARISVIEGLPELYQLRRGADGAEVLLLESAAEGAFTALDAILPIPARLPDIAHVQPGVATSLRDLEFTDLDAYNRYSEQRLAFRLPDDWLMLSSAKARLRLSYGFAQGLPVGALMLVKVNDITVRLLPLDLGGDEILPPLDIVFSANLLGSGPNELTFVAVIPGDPSDMPCPNIEAPLMTINADSTLYVPPTPRMTFVDVREALMSIGPDQIGSTANRDSAQQTTDLTLALASAMRPVAGRPGNGQARLTVLETDNLQQVMSGELGLNRRDLEAVFLDRFSGATQTPPREPAAGVFGLDKVVAWGRRAIAGLAGLAKPGDGSINDWLQGRRGEAALVMPDPQSPHDIWLIVASNRDPVQVADAVARARLSPVGPRGQFSLLTADGTWENWQDASLPPVLLEPLSLSNFRAVVGNYASWAPLYFVSVLFAFTVLSVVLALIFVISTRGKRKQ